MSNTHCSEFSSINLVTLKNAVCAITNLEVDVEVTVMPMLSGMTEQAECLCQLKWDEILHQVLPLVTEIEAVHKRCHKLQTLLSKANKAAENSSEVLMKILNTLTELLT